MENVQKTKEQQTNRAPRREWDNEADLITLNITNPTEAIEKLKELCIYSVSHLTNSLFDRRVVSVDKVMVETDALNKPVESLKSFVRYCQLNRVQYKFIPIFQRAILESLEQKNQAKKETEQLTHG